MEKGRAQWSSLHSARGKGRGLILPIPRAQLGAQDAKKDSWNGPLSVSPLQSNLQTPATQIQAATKQKADLHWGSVTDSTPAAGRTLPLLITTWAPEPGNVRCRKAEIGGRGWNPGEAEGWIYGRLTYRLAAPVSVPQRIHLGNGGRLSGPQWLSPGIL